ncbi:NUDIX hydrolase [Escherichia coli]|uniref:NUDIX hydrolase n=1 Tax=Escherichia coli TaxID=562 RepID=UPI0013318F19|nr:NUDIX hydrolase [Escherichia coli]EGJ7875508.1 NUDIX hydrolase [Escherichia coli]EGM7823684.1 NUDIX hydrolase [Escherichia coli]EHD1547907.1 NUDIX hydrolase [Escherichia coli]EHH5034108.1 NUDIX hydrolase [Escherichia coli]EJI1469658.1 NUDIX hydrolase [Escherichia coli]
MPASKEDLRLKLMEVVNALSESQGSTPQEIIEILNAIPAQDFTKADEDNANQNIVASVEDESSLAEAQAKADSAYSNMGRRAPAPFAGEKSMDYRKRALIGAQKLAKKFSDVDIRSVSDSATLAVLEDQIYKAAQESAQWAVENTPGHLGKTVRMDEAGRRITEYQGDPNVWLNAFKIPPRRLVKINTASLSGE